MEFKDRIKELLTERNMSMNQLAKLMNVNRISVWKWQYGYNFPKEPMLEKLADYFDVSLDYLMGRSDIKNNSDNREQSEPDILIRYNKLSDSQKLIISNLINELLDK